MDRPALQLQELQELQKQHVQQMQEGLQQQQQDGGLASEGAEPTPKHGGERGLREFNYNGRVRNSERASERASSGVLGQQHPHRSSFSLYSNYSSYSSSSDGRGGRDQNGGGGGGGGGGVGRGIPPPRPPRSPLPPLPPPLPHIQQPPRQRSMEVPPAPGTAGTVNTVGTEATAVAGTESVQQVRQPPPPPPTYGPPHDPYNRVRFADEERYRQEEASRGRSAQQIDMAQITGGHSARALWVFACCAFFCYRCFMDEDF
ncbi:hypothetical protein ColLi_01984 [Colletotrichum liriopes]|uniref:Uncharacterized protein n=1 Tax=Colletotrichum liriopes TaxID=708192 RepID=A0AA37GEV5_9PEZI|nr:hypothetical protein ColLi_01984 [Colletotrichum liriopes]